MTSHDFNLKFQTVFFHGRNSSLVHVVELRVTFSLKVSPEKPLNYMGILTKYFSPTTFQNWFLIFFCRKYEKKKLTIYFVKIYFVFPKINSWFILRRNLLFRSEYQWVGYDDSNQRIIFWSKELLPKITNDAIEGQPLSGTVIHVPYRDLVFLW